MKLKLAINGFGRIGRVFLRAALSRSDFWEKFEVVAINDIAKADMLAYLLKYDSTYGKLDQAVSIEGNELIVGERRIAVYSNPDPASLPWKELEVDYVLESSGVFRTREGAEKHLKAGAKRVVISAPAKEPDVTVVPGVNMQEYDPSKHRIVSMASCTTNCLAPMVKVLHDNFGVERGFITTVHAYTNDQRVLDAPHKKDFRRARACNLSIIPTTTGAAKAIGLVLPELSGKLNGMALRVPVHDASITDLVAVLKTEVSRDDVNEAYKEASRSELKGILEYTEEPVVSIDIVGNPHSCIIDGLSTMANGNLVKVLGWYDNEWGYCNRLVDLLLYMHEQEP